MTLSKKNIQAFQQKIFDWWKGHKRDLPWRHTHDPYKIMVSEVMLQQTQVSRVLMRYAEFIEVYPDVQSLAKAKTSDVLKIWKGMGYNRRALYLHQAAKIISEKYHNHFPLSQQLLSKLPGVGKYTARAILVFAHKKDIAMVDTNIRKIITHFFFQDKKQPENVIQDLADQLLPKGKSWQWHQALMDLGSQMQTISNAKCPMSNKKLPFRESNRFFRGRIVDLLREKGWKETALLREMVKRHGKDVQFYKKILEKLLQEGLLTRSPSAIISLPE